MKQSVSNLERRIAFASYKIKLFLIQEVKLNPFIFLTVSAFQLLQFEIPHESYFVLFICSILYALMFFFNHFYFYNYAINQGLGWLSTVNIFMCILATNETWKFYLLIFTLGGFLQKAENVLYMALVSTLIAYQIHKYFIFRTPEDNRVFFCGFGTIALYAWSKYILLSLDEEYNYLFIIIPISIYSLGSVFKEKQQDLLEIKHKNIKSSSVAFHYICLTKQKFHDEFYKQVIISKHKAICKEIDCMCRLPQKQEKMDQNIIIKNLYEQFLDNQNASQWEFLENKYVQYLLDQEKIISAILRIKKQRKACYNYFRLVQRLRNIEKIKSKVALNDYILAQSSLFLQIFEYDEACKEQVQEITQILDSKINFWKEVAKQSPAFKFLQQNGISLVEKEERLHYSYQKNIKKLQQSLKCCIGTIHYATFLVSSTNYIQYAKTLLKATKRSLEEMRLSNSNLSQTQGFCSKQKQSKDVSAQTEYIYIVENVSKAFCRLLKKNKAEIIGSQIQEFIPSIYWKSHIRGIKQFMKGKINKNSKFLGIKHNFPLRLNQKYIQQIKAYIKIYPGITNEIKFICLVETPVIEKKLIITNFKGENLGSQPYSKPEILKHQQIASKLQSLQLSWKNRDQIIAKQFLLVQQDDRYIVQIQCPFSNSYMEQDYPPLHLLYLNQSEADFQNYLQDIYYHEFKNIMEKIEENYQEKPNSADSITSTQGKTSIVNILFSYTQSKRIIFFQKLTLLIVIYAIISVSTVSIITNVSTGLENLDNQNSNLMQNFKTMVDIQEGFLKVFIVTYDYEAVQKNYFTNQTLAQLYGQTSTQYLKAINNFLISRYSSLDELISSKLPLFPQESRSLVQKYFQQGVNITFKGLAQQLDLFSLIKNCEIDVLLLSQGTPFSQTLLSSTFNDFILPTLTKIIDDFIDLYDVKNNQIIIWNFILLSLFVVLIISFPIPWIWFHLKLIQKKVTLYQLMVSTQVSLIKQHLTLLTKTRNTFRKIKFQEQMELLSIASVENVLDDKRETLRVSQMGTTSINFKNQSNFINVGDSEEIMLRRRSGELSLENSEACKKKINFINWIFPSITLITLILLVASVSVKLTKNSQFENIQQLFYKKHKNIAMQHILLMNAKYMYEETNETILKEATFSNVPLNMWFKAVLSQQHKNFEYRDFDDAPHYCSDSRKDIKLCQYPNSQQSLSAMLLKIVDQSFTEFQFQQTTKKNQNKVSLFFANTIMRQLAGIHSGQITNLIERKQKLQNQLKDNLQNILILGCILGLIIFLGGLWFVNYYRLKYIKQVTMLSFLSNRMIQNSKQAQSYLQRLSKQR